MLTLILAAMLTTSGQVDTIRGDGSIVDDNAPIRSSTGYRGGPSFMAFDSAFGVKAPACRADGHNKHRSRAALATFRHAHPCPGGPDRGSTKRCHGYVIDHICPLECCGPDAPANMQWQTEEEGKAKDRWEGDCKRSCHKS